MKSSLPALLLALCAAAGCSDQPSTQVLTGRVTTSGATAVRAVSNGTVVTAARVRSDGSFTLSLPAGTNYQLQVLTSGGVQHVLNGHAALAFDVCHPTDPFDLGGVGHGGGTGLGSGSGGCGMPPPPDNCDPATGLCCDAAGNCMPMPCDPMTDPSCQPPPPPNCDPTTDPMCPPPGCDPSTGSGCMPPPCDPSTGSGCMPPPCDPTTDPSCQPPPPPMCDPSGTCMCDPTTDADCPTPPPPCTDPTDPQTCQDPCMGDPMQCGCDPSGTQPCWPPPPPCDASGNCMGMVPDHPPGDFGCGGG